MSNISETLNNFCQFLIESAPIRLLIGVIMVILAVEFAEYLISVEFTLLSAP